MLLFGEGWPPVVSAGAPGRNITFSNGFHRPLWLIRTAARAPSTQLPFGGKLEMFILPMFSMVFIILCPACAAPYRAKL